MRRFCFVRPPPPPPPVRDIFDTRGKLAANATKTITSVINDNRVFHTVVVNELSTVRRENARIYPAFIPVNKMISGFNATAVERVAKVLIIRS